MSYSKSARGKGSIRKRKYEKILVFGLLIVLFISPFFLYSMMSNQPVRSNIDVNPEENLKVNDFSKDDYEPILTKKQQSLGKIILKDFEYNKEGFYNVSELQEELGTILNITEGSINVEFLSMETAAMVYNLGLASENSKKIVLNLRDSLRANYDITVPSEDDDRYILYRPKLDSINIKDVYFSNISSSTLVKLSEENGDYDIIENDFVRFNYYDYFQNDSREFRLYIDYFYNIPLINWTMNQNDINNLIFQNESKPLYPKFTYRFNISTTEVPGTTYSSQRVLIPVPLDLNITLPNKDQIYNHSLTVNNVGLSPNTYLTEDNIINLTLSGNNSELLLNFNTKITMKFEKPVENTWAIDRLIEQNDVRERIYFPTIISGPSKIYFYVSILENTISSDQVRSTESLFEREVSYSSVDTRDVEEEIGDSLVFTEQASVKQGIKVRLPFILPNETAPFSIKYQVTENLRIVVTDNIDMPAQNLRLKVYYQGKEYGSYISVDKVLPLADLTTNANGEVSINNAPNGFYRVEVYQGNNLLANTTINSYQRTNYITTDIPHFPTTIIIFSSVNAILLAAGAFIYIRTTKEKQK